MDHHQFTHATSELERAAVARRRAWAGIEQEAIDALARGDRARATATIETLLSRQPNASRWWHELALLHLQGDDVAGAMDAWREALLRDSDDLALLHQIGQGLATAGQDAAHIFEQTWAQRPSRFPAQFRDACLAVVRGQWRTALPILKTLLEADPKSQQAAHNLALLLECMGTPGKARCVLAASRLARGKIAKAVETFDAAPVADARSPEFITPYLQALRLDGQELRAIEIASTLAPEACPPDAYSEWAEALISLHRLDEATEVLLRGGTLHGDEHLLHHARTVLPAVPATQAALEQAHARACHVIRALEQSPLPMDADRLASLEDSLRPGFLLNYLGTPCVEEARAYGRFSQRIMQARYPDDAVRPDRGRHPGKRIRIGYATSYASQHVVMMYFTGWLQHADRSQFEIHLFPLASGKDRISGYLPNMVDVCHPTVAGIKDATRQIRESELDVLVYPEIGTDTLSFRLAAMRLAPVQCVASGHPVTTGLPTIDYFLSIARAEPADGSEHYTERLVGLPGVGICMPQPILPDAPRTRADFGLAEEDIVYLSPQSMFKYLPRHDEVFARIAQSVDNAVFVFAEGTYPAWTRTFDARLRQAFEARGLSADRHMKFLPKQGYGRYLSLNLASDVFLDPLGGFSAGMTAVDALACGLPIVTLPGKVMRTRLSYAMLAGLGIEDAIATDVDDYVRLAIRLGNDKAFRTSLAQRTRERAPLLFNHTDGLKGLEAFFRWVTGSARPGDDALFELGPARPADGLNRKEAHESA